MKQIFLVLFIFTAVFFPVYGQEYSTKENEITASYIEHFSGIGFIAGKIVVNNGYLPLLYTLHDADLAVLTKEELRILRNTVYAKYGLIFQSKDLTAHFSRFSWYKAQNRNVDNRLTAADKYLIQRILAFENAAPNKNLTVNDLLGTWLGTFPNPAGYVNNIVIHKDNTIEFGYNSMALRAVTSARGTYKIENGFLVVLITEQRIAVGEFFHEGYASVSGGMEGTIFGKITFTTPVRMVFPVGNLKSTYEGEEIYSKVRQIGSYDRVYGEDTGLY